MRPSRTVRTLLGVLALATAGCVGSKTPYHPYKGEPRPLQEVAPDPIRDAVELQYGVPNSVHHSTSYIAETRKGHQEVLDHVHTNPDGTRRNAWNAYATDMNGTLGSGTVREAPRNLPKDQQMLKKSEEKPADAAEKPAEGAEKPAEKPAEK